MGKAVRLWSLALVIFLASGAVGAYAYVQGAWRYRGFPPPSLPATLPVAGQPGRTVAVHASVLRTIQVTSPALGGRSMRVLVLLPAGYATSPDRRYPVLYLLHGTPGRPDGFIDVAQVAVWQAELTALGRIRPMIIVMPSGGVSSFQDTEWANGVSSYSGWATYVARDVVGTIDATFRTIPQGWARAIGGLSEGGYGAINIALQHPGEFDTVESWSGYEIAADVPAVFGNDPAVARANSPLFTVGSVAATLRRDGVHFWFYSSADRYRTQNESFASELLRLHVPHHFFVVQGGHDWATWRAHVSSALVAASRGLAPRPRPQPRGPRAHFRAGPQGRRGIVGTVVRGRR